MIFRINRIPRNWVLQEFHSGGKIHPVTGKLTEDSWQDVGYYGRLSHLVT